MCSQVSNPSEGSEVHRNVGDTWKKEMDNEDAGAGANDEDGLRRMAMKIRWHVKVSAFV